TSLPFSVFPCSPPSLLSSLPILLPLTLLRPRTTRAIASYVPCEETLSRRVPPARDTVTPTGRRSPLPAPARKTTGPTISGRLRVPSPAGKYPFVNCVGRNVSEGDR